jgi:hypothetical protein
MTSLSPFLPTRLIKVETTAENSLRLSLAIKEEIDYHARYVALSHCWGNIQPVRLLEATFDEMRKSISYDSLPKTFQDAIHIVQRLKVQYLWIDSLCIIQDSPKDWEEESDLMSLVYCNCFLNVAATAAVDGSIGLFFERDTSKIRPLKLKIRTNLSEELQSYHVVDDRLWEAGVELAPLNQRAWVCQERIISPRTLHFGSEQLFWECRSHSACESLPGGIGPVMEGRRKFGIPITAIDHTNENTLQRAMFPPSLIWANVVRTYSRGLLSYEKDKLVAVSGLVKVLQPQFNSQYLAGLWKAWLLFQLLWRAMGNGMRYSTYVAPTWSWASVNGKTDIPTAPNDLDNIQHLIEILDVQVIPVSKSPFGQLKSGFIRLLGKLSRLQDIKSGDGHWKLLEKNGLRCYCYVNQQGLSGPAWIRFMVFQDVNEQLDFFSETSRDLVLLPIAKVDMSCHALVLKRNGSAVKTSQFTRCGLLTTEDTDAGKIVERAARLFDEDWPEHNGLERSSDGKGGFKYIITII